MSSNRAESLCNEFTCLVSVPAVKWCSATCVPIASFCIAVYRVYRYIRQQTCYTESWVYSVSILHYLMSAAKLFLSLPSPLSFSLTLSLSLSPILKPIRRPVIIEIKVCSPIRLQWLIMIVFVMVSFIQLKMCCRFMYRHKVQLL